MNFSRYDPTSYDAYAQMDGNCPQNSYRLLSPSAFTGIIPSSLLDKTHNILTMRTAYSGNDVFLNVINRIDQTASAIDQELYLISFDHSRSAYSGYFGHHGNWPYRTVPLSATAMPNSPGMPSAPSGHIHELGAHYTGLFQTAFSAPENCK